MRLKHSQVVITDNLIGTPENALFDMNYVDKSSKGKTSHDLDSCIVLLNLWL